MYKRQVQTQFGWHVILLEETKQSEPPSLEGMRGEIITSLQKRALSDYMQGMRTDSSIVFNKDLEAGGQEAAPTAAAESEPPSEENTASEETKPTQE